MKKLLILFVLMSFQSFFSQTENTTDFLKEPDSVIKAKAFIEEYYADFKTEYDNQGDYYILSDSYRPKFSGSKFSMTYNSYDKKEKTVNTVKFDFKEVISIEFLNYNTILVHDDPPFDIIISGTIGFKTKEEMHTFEMNGQEFISGLPVEIYKAFETVWKYYQHTKMDQRKLDELNERLKMERNTEWPKPDQKRIEAEKKAQEEFKNKK